MFLGGEVLGLSGKHLNFSCFREFLRSTTGLPNMCSVFLLFVLSALQQAFKCVSVHKISAFYLVSSLILSFKSLACWTTRVPLEKLVPASKETKQLSRREGVGLKANENQKAAQPTANEEARIR